MALTTIEPFGINSSNTFTFGGVTATGNVTANNVIVGNTVSVVGNISADYVLGNGTQLSGVLTTDSAANAELLSGTSLSSNVVSSSLTAVGTLTTLSVTGNIDAGNVTTDILTASDVSTANVFATTISATGNVTSFVVNTTDVFASSISTTDFLTTNVAATAVTSTTLSATGNVNAGNAEISGIVTAVTVSATTLSATGNVDTANVTASYVNVSGGNVDAANVNTTFITAIGNVNAGNFGTTGTISAGGNVESANLNTGLITATTGNITNVNASIVSATGNVNAGNVISLGIISATGNATVGNLTTSIVNATVVSASGNVTANYFIGNGSQLTGLPETYANANVEAYLPTYTGNLVALTGNVITTANISGNYFIGNGSQLTGLPETYANANVEAYLPTYTGNLVALTGNVITTANISANYFLGNGSQLTGIQAGAVTTFSSTAPVSPAQGDIWIDADTGIQYIYFNDGTSSQWAEMEAQTSIAPGADLSAINQDILPAADVTYDLGSATHRWRDIYLSGNTINLGGATIKTDAASGAIALIPEPTVANPNPSGMVVSPSGGITVVSTTGGVVSGNAIANAAGSPTAAPVPIDITTTAPQNGQALIWDAANSEFVPGNVSAGGGGSAVTVYGNIASLPLANVTTGSMAFVSSNNRLYLWNGTGWFNIALINTNPTITGGVDPTYLFAIDGTPTVLTLTASDPEGIPLTWSYQVTSGVLGNTATITQSDNVFTLTPSTQEADAGVFEVTFSASDGVNLGTAAASFTLAFGAADQYYNQSVLVSTTATNNGTNNTFVDSSTNNFTVTRNGNATQGAFGPFSPAGWSGFFDGTGDYLSIANNAAFNFDAGDFTIELWANFNTSATIQTFVSNYANSSTGWGFQRRSDTNALNFFYGDTVLVSRSFTPTLGQWYCLTISRQGTDLKMWVDGVQQGATVTNSTNFTSAGSLFVGTLNAAIAQPFNGYISNLRVVKGTALYTANFTPSTTPLTAVSGTSLLTLQSNRFVDNSVNNFVITRNGDTRITPFSPFEPLDPYSTSVNGGSAYFDGTGDFLTVPSNAVFQFGTGDFTIECWIYKLNAGNGPIIDARGASTAVPWALYVDANNFPYFYSGTSYTSTVAILNSQWNHVVAVRTSSVLKIFVNGVEGYSASHTVALNPSATVYIGGQNFSSSSLMTGYISNLRIVKGTAVYTAAFTPPTAPVTAIANTSLLLNSTNANIYDQTGKVDLETVGDAKTSTAVVKYGDSSMYFDGSGDQLSVPGGPTTDLGTGDFTIESWSYLTAAGDAYRTVVAIVFPSKQVVLRYGNGTAYGQKLQVSVQADTAGVVWSTSLTQTASLNQWIHLAFTRSSGVCRLFVNGVLQNINSGLNPGTYPVTSFNDTTNVVGSTVLYVGSDNFTGYLSDVRITKGVARYTANFTPPTAQLGFNNPE